MEKIVLFKFLSRKDRFFVVSFSKRSFFRSFFLEKIVLCMCLLWFPDGNLCSIKSLIWCLVEEVHVDMPRVVMHDFYK